MFAEIHFPRALELDRDEVEDAIADAIAGFGEVSGAGTGIYGSNLDLDLADETSAEDLIATVRSVIVDLEIVEARIRIEGDDEWTSLT